MGDVPDTADVCFAGGADGMDLVGVMQIDFPGLFKTPEAAADGGASSPDAVGGTGKVSFPALRAAPRRREPPPILKNKSATEASGRSDEKLFAAGNHRPPDMRQMVVDLFFPDAEMPGKIVCPHLLLGEPCNHFPANGLAQKLSSSLSMQQAILYFGVKKQMGRAFTIDRS